MKVVPFNLVSAKGPVFTEKVGGGYRREGWARHRTKIARAVGN